MTAPEKISTIYGNVWAYPSDHIGKILLGGDYYEHGKIVVMLNNCKQKRVAIDVGGCYGTHSLAFSKQFQRVYTFEPQKHLYDLICKTLSGSNNSKITNAAVGHIVGNTRIAMDDDSEETNFGSHQININNGEIISMVTLDSQFPSSDDVDLIKIDVEGAESLVFYGAKELIKRCRPVIFFEYNRRERFLQKNHIWLDDIAFFSPLEFLLGECGYKKVERISNNFLAIP